MGDSMFSVFRTVRQPSDADCVILIEYYSELLTCQKIGKSFHDENIPINGVFNLNYNQYIFVFQDFSIF